MSVSKPYDGGIIMTIISDIELKKMAAKSALLEPKTITFNQNGWNKFIDSGPFISESGQITTPTKFTRYNMVLGLIVHFDMKQEEDFIIGVI